MEVLNLIILNIDNIVACLLIVAIVIVLIKKGETKVLKEILFGLITKAEGEFGSGTGKLKYATVVDWLYERIPTILKPLFSSKELESLIETALTEAKDKWAKNPKLVQIESMDEEVTVEKISEEVIE
jgi:alpha/beta superfamily hydrolase